jgi:S1-C subfamily serine protease
MREVPPDKPTSPFAIAALLSRGVRLAALFLIVATMAQAQEAAKPGERRLTPQQNTKVLQTRRPKLDEAYQLFQEGKPAAAILIVNEIIAFERQVLKEAESNPIEDELPQPASPFMRDLIPPQTRLPTLRTFQAESLGTLEFLEQLHETLGDYRAAKGVAEEIAGLTAQLVAARTWPLAQARAEVQRLERLASLDLERLRVIEQARKATALVATGSGPLGTAFCIDPNGLFLTLDEVAIPPAVQVTTHLEYDQSHGLRATREEHSPKTHPMAIVLNLGRPDVKQLPARVVWKDRESRLVVLKAQTNEPLPALEIAGAGSAVLRQEAVLLGLAFVGRNPGIYASPTPTVRAHPGQVTAIRERKSKLWFYQIDHSPPPGYSGGPVLDDRGRVIGMIVVGLPGTDIHYVLPVDTTTAPFAAPIVDFDPPPLPYRDRHNPVDWTVRLFSKQPLAKDVTVEIRLGNDAGARLFPARPTGERVYSARVIPVADAVADPVGLTLEGSAAPVRATVADRAIRIGETTVRLSELRRVAQGPSPQALTTDGRRLIGPVTGLGVIEGTWGKPGVVLDTREAPKISFECPAPDVEPIEAEVVLKQGKDVLSRVHKTLGYGYAPFETSRRIDPAKVGPAEGLRPIEAPVVLMAAASVGGERAIGAPLVRQFSEKIAALAVGGAGRYLLLHLKGQRQLAIFDAQWADVSGIIDLADDDPLITANADKGFVAYPKLRLIDRIDLASARVDRSAAFPFEATPRVIQAGSASVGPVFSIFHMGPADNSFAQPVQGFLDPETMDLIAPRIIRLKNGKDWTEVPGRVLIVTDPNGRQQSDYTTAPSGDVFCNRARIPGVVYTLNSDVADVFETNSPDAGFVPTFARGYLFTKSGRYDLDGTRRAVLPDSESILGVLPSHDPAYYLVVRTNSQPAARGTPPRPILEVFSAASDRRLFVVDGLDEMIAHATNELHLLQRYHLIPSARLMITIPVENDRLVLRRLDILSELYRLEIDEIVVTSPSVIGAVVGQPFRHRVEAYAKGGATFERADGPEGLSVSPDGDLRWDVPRVDAGQEKVAVVAVRSATGQKVLHKMHILVRGRG